MCDADPILIAFEKRRSRDPGAPMLISTRCQATVADVDRMARAAAARLAASGLRGGGLVGLAAVNGPGFLAGLLAIRRAGSAALLFDGRCPAAEKDRTARSLGAAAILESRGWPQEEKDFAVAKVDAEPAARQRIEDALAPDVAVVKLTSGSTGAPRGVVTPATALVADDAALAATMGLAEDERILAAIPMSHSYGLSSVVMPALMRDAVLVLPEATNPFAPWAVARAQGVTFWPTAPAYLHNLVRMSKPPSPPDSLRLVVSAGAPLRPDTAERFQEIYGRPVHVFYGASECGGITYDRTGDAGRRGSLGTPVDGVDVRLEPVPGTGENGRGTVTVRSAAVARSYLPEPSPSLAGGRFRTCDLGGFRDGELYLDGRLDEVINIRGKKVHPREVEAVLGRLEGVEEAVALGVCLPGQEEKILRSFVAGRRGRLTYENVLGWCRRHLAEHKVPRSVVLLDEIPRTSRGKIDRAALLKLGPGGDGA